MLELAPSGNGLRAAGKNLPTIVGNRPNKLHQGATASNMLMQVSKPDFKEMNKDDFATKRTFLGEALVKDPCCKVGRGRRSHGAHELPCDVS